MRIAAIGIPLQPSEARHTVTPVRYRDATPLDGFDGVLWAPDALPTEYEDALGDDGALTVAGSQAFLADLRRRRLEMQALLEAGGTLVIEPPAPDVIRVHTLEAIHHLPLIQALPVDGVTLRRLQPEALSFHGGEPFRSFWQRAGAMLAPTVCIAGAPGEHLLRAGDDVLGCYWAQRSGRVLLLPPPRPECRSDWLAAVAALLVGLRGEASDRLPIWAQRYVAQDEAPLRTACGQLAAERARLDQKLAETERALLPLERRKRLFTAEARALVEAVSDAFWQLGCSVLQGPFGEHDVVLEHEAGLALALVAGGSGPIERAALDQLGAWCARAGARENRRFKGILVANPYRDRPISDRPPLDPALIAAADAAGTLLITGFDLWGLVVAAGTAPASRQAAVRALFGAQGLWQPEPRANVWRMAAD
jgi:hypothetical protein